MKSHCLSVRKRRGIVAPFVAVVMLALLSCAALVIDLGYIYVARAEMQTAADSAALAGASGLRDGDFVAHARAVEYAGRNAVSGDPVIESEADVRIGNWEGHRRRFTPAGDDEMVSPNAVRVVGERTRLPLFFARVMGVDSADIARGAVAISGGGVCSGVWGLEGINGDGDIRTDSYDTRLGAYGPGNVHRNGDICSCRDILLNGSADVYGDAMYGDGYALLTSGNAYNVWGVIAHNDCDSPIPEIDVAGAAADNDNATIGLTDRGRDPFSGSPWDLVVSGVDNLTLAGGTYYFTSALINGRATLTIAGPTVIYVSGPAEFTGNGVTNLSQNPADLLIYSTGTTMSLSGTAGFYGAVIAPETDIALVGTGEYFGMLMGRTLDIDGTADIHVDESLIENVLGGDVVAPILVQ